MSLSSIVDSISRFRINKIRKLPFEVAATFCCQFSLSLSPFFLYTSINGDRIIGDRCNSKQWQQSMFSERERAGKNGTVVQHLIETFARGKFHFDEYYLAPKSQTVN